MVSIVVGIYNVSRFLKEKRLRCIIDQTYHYWELILIDDGSTDDSGALCDDFARQDSRIKVIHKENGGLGSARNAGLDVATGEYIWFYAVERLLLNIEKGEIHIGHHSKVSAKRFWVRFGGIVRVGNYTNINSGSEIRCDESVSIGSYNQISFNVNIWDTNTHNILPALGTRIHRSCPQSIYS